MIDKIFVYGTLMNLEWMKRNWGIVPKKIENAWTYGKLYHCFGFPVMVEGRSKVFGKLLTIEELKENPKIFDSYEGCYENSPNSIYHRKILKVETSKGRKTAYVYVGNKKNHLIKKCLREENLIKNGKWKSKS